jgi:uncharacterized membrane protein (DUF485 family)
MPNDASSKHISRVSILETISAPLGFFVLALLIVEAFLGTVLIGTKLESASVLLCIYLGVALFILVVVVVAILVWFKPDHLTFDRSAHLERLLSRVELDLKRNSELDELLRRGMYLRMNKRYEEGCSGL